MPITTIDAGKANLAARPLLLILIVFRVLSVLMNTVFWGGGCNPQHARSRSRRKLPLKFDRGSADPAAPPSGNSDPTIDNGRLCGSVHCRKTVLGRPPPDWAMWEGALASILEKKAP